MRNVFALRHEESTSVTLIWQERQDSREFEHQQRSFSFPTEQAARDFAGSGRFTQALLQDELDVLVMEHML